MAGGDKKQTRSHQTTHFVGIRLCRRVEILQKKLLSVLTSHHGRLSWHIFLGGCSQGSSEATLSGGQLGILSQVGIQVLAGLPPEAGGAPQHVKGLEGAVKAIMGGCLEHWGALDR